MKHFFLFTLGLVLASLSTRAQDESRLAQELANPVAVIYTIPFQNNVQFMAGAERETQFLMNFQPVIPIKLGAKLNLITRTIVPILNKPLVGPGTMGGIGEILHSQFFSPNNDSPFFWGAGPVIQFKSATSTQLGTMKWALGPTAVGLYQKDRFTGGLLVNHLWSVGGDPNRPDFSRLYMEPFIIVAVGDFEKGATLGLSSEIAANWKLKGQERWTAPVILDYSQIIDGAFPLQIGFGGGYFVSRTDTSPHWMLRVNFNLVIAG